MSPLGLTTKITVLVKTSSNLSASQQEFKPTSVKQGTKMKRTPEDDNAGQQGKQVRRVSLLQTLVDEELVPIIPFPTRTQCSNFSGQYYISIT
jgi:hypothetical protein